MKTDSIRISFDDNSLLPLLFGQHDQFLARLEQQLSVSLQSFGNEVTVSGDRDERSAAKKALRALYARLKKGLDVQEADIDAAARLALNELNPVADDSHNGATGASALHDEDLRLITRKRHIQPRSPRQAHYIRALKSKELVFGMGPAGTGKTYLAVACAVHMLQAGHVDRLILSRPAVEAGERLGFLPGDLKDKIDPYLRPLYDALHDMMPGEQVTKRLESGEIEIAPLAFMRGRTLANSYIILDEAQNTTTTQMKMFLTRLGENSRMVINGDLSQIDLPKGQYSGLKEATQILKGMDEIGYVQFTSSDVVRHGLVTKIVHAYDQKDKNAWGHRDLFADKDIELSPDGETAADVPQSECD